MNFKITKKLIFISVLLVAILSGAYFVIGGYGQNGPDSAPNLEEYGLVGYWNFEEGSGQTVYDRSGNGNDGTLGASTAVGKDDPVFAPGHDSNGPGGTGLQFDGVDDYVDAGSDESLNITDVFTIEVWVKANSWSSSGPEAIVDKSSGEYYGYELYNNYGAIMLRLWENYASIGYASFGAISTGEWHHLVGVWNGTNVIAYLNGTQKDIQNGTSPSQTLGTFKIGGWGTRMYDGAIDEVRIYNRALSADEIRMHYNQKKPVLRLKMDEGSGTTVHDESFNDNDGTLNLGTSGNTTVSSAWADGKHGSAINFDGIDDYVDIGNKAGTILDITNEITLEAWVYPQNTAGFRNIINNFDFAGYGSSKGYILQIQNGQFQIFLRDIGAKSDATPYLNKWVHVVGTFDGTNSKLYLDGVLKSTVPLSPPLSQTTYNFAIGKSIEANGEVWEGLIDDVRIYNYARTADEIFTDYNDGKAAHLGKNNQRDDGLVGYWNFEEGSGQTVYDRSGNGNDGTLGASTAVEKSDPVFAPGHDSNGPGGTGLQFDGVDDYVKVNPQMTGVSNFSMEAWIKPTVGDNSTNFIFGAGGSSVQNWVVNGTVLQFLCSSGYANATIVYGEWSHIVLLADSNGHYVYVNGVLKGSDSGTCTVLSDYFRIGDYPSGGYSFNGVIDEVRIYNRALSADEIRMHYNQKKPVLRLKMDEGSGTTVYDESFNDNDANFPATDANKPSWSAP